MADSIIVSGVPDALDTKTMWSQSVSLSLRERAGASEDAPRESPSQHHSETPPTAPRYNAPMSPPAKPASMTDSPWFWAYLFGVGALIALALAAPKFSNRQAQEERRFQGRERAAQQQAGVEPTGELSTPDATQITLRPLFLALAAITSVTWMVYWLQRKRPFARQSGTADNIAKPPRGDDSATPKSSTS